VMLNTFSWGEEADFRDFSTHRAGEFSVPAAGGSHGRRQIEIADLETLSLDWHARWLTEYSDPGHMKRQLRSVLRARTPVELLATLRGAAGSPEELRCLVTLRRIDVELRPGEADTRYWRLQVKEYRRHDTERRTADPTPHLPTRHRLEAGDTLESLSAHYYKNPEGWRTIAAANGLGSWGRRTPIVRSRRFKKGDWVKILKPVRASISPPRV
jgi:nucleoid-associated protein YgaU